MKPWCGRLPIGERARAGDRIVSGRGLSHSEESNAGGVQAPWDLHPTRCALSPSRARTALSDYSSEPPSVTAQSHAFQKIVGAMIDGSMFSTRSLYAVTLGNWKMVTP